MTVQAARECLKPDQFSHYICVHPTLSALPAVRGCEGCWMHSQLGQSAVEPSNGIAPLPDAEPQSFNFHDIVEPKGEE